MNAHGKPIECLMSVKRRHTQESINQIIYPKPKFTKFLEPCLAGSLEVEDLPQPKIVMFRNDSLRYGSVSWWVSLNARVATK
jgi:hypothetical protein